MNTMLYGLLLFVHIIVSISLIVTVLLQSSKGGGLAGTFGGTGMTGGIFGGRGAAPFLVKATTLCAVLFMFTSISLNFVKSGSSSQSVLERTLRTTGGTAGSEPAVLDEIPLPADNTGGSGEVAAESDNVPGVSGDTGAGSDNVPDDSSN